MHHTATPFVLYSKGLICRRQTIAVAVIMAVIIIINCIHCYLQCIQIEITDTNILYSELVSVCILLMQLSFSPAHSRKMSGRECVRSLWMFVLLHLSIQTELFTAHKHDPICFSCVVFSLSLFAFYRTLLYSSVCIALRSVPFYFPLGAFNCMHFHDICMYLSARQ